MSRSNWHILRDGPVLTLARHLPARFDVVAKARLPKAARARLAHQIRQDMWRALQSQRGFSPVVEITERGDGVDVRAGGRVDTHRFNRDGLEARIADVLQDKENRDRWMRCTGTAE